MPLAMGKMDAVAPAPTAPAAPATTPSPEGLQVRARLQLVIARKLLEVSLPILGAHSEDGKAVLTALKALSGVVKDASPGLIGSEVKAEGTAPILEKAGPPSPPPPGVSPAGPQPGTMLMA